MSDSEFETIERALGDADTLLRKRLVSTRLEALHVMLALADNGAAIIRSNVGPDMLRQMGQILIDIADQQAPSAAAVDDGTRH